MVPPTTIQSDKKIPVDSRTITCSQCSPSSRSLIYVRIICKILRNLRSFQSQMVLLGKHFCQCQETNLCHPSPSAKLQLRLYPLIDRRLFIHPGHPPNGPPVPCATPPPLPWCCPPPFLSRPDLQTQPWGPNPAQQRN